MFASRYWVGGSGNWSDTSHWSASSGGASGASAPVAADDAKINSSSGSPTVTLDQNIVVKSLAFVGAANATVDANGFNVTAEDVELDFGANSHYLMGSGTWRVTVGWGMPINDTSSVDPGTSTLIIDLSGRSTPPDGGGIDFVFRHTVTCSYHNLIVRGNSTDAYNVLFGKFSGTNWLINFNVFSFKVENAPLIIKMQEGVTVVAGTVTMYGTPAKHLGIKASDLFGAAPSFQGNFTLQATVAQFRYVDVQNVIAAGSVPFSDIGGTDNGGNTNFVFTNGGELPTYNTSLMSAIARVQQNLAFPTFVIGGLGGASNDQYALFKKSSNYIFSLFRDQVHHVGRRFTVKSITLNFATALQAGQQVTPVLRFDHDQISSAGEPINLANYPDAPNQVTLTPDNFPDGVEGFNHFYLELQFTGTVLMAVSLPIIKKCDVDEPV